MSSFLALPTEILEQILVQCGHNGSPESISTISQTCKELRDLIYDTTIWREVYLSVLDSPFVPQEVIAKFVGGKGILEKGKFEWKRRLVAVMSLQKQLKTLDLAENLDGYIFTLSGLAAAPFPVFPDRPCHPSLNAVWVDKLLADGFPKPLIDRLMRKSPVMSYTTNSAAANDSLKWEATNVGEQFYRLVLQTGFRPHQAVTPDINSCSSPARQQALTRAVARHHVYNMLYPSASRCWGPFLPCPASVLDPSQPKEPHLLVPDYPFLSAARIVMEANLRESLEESDESEGMISMVWESDRGQVWPLFTYEFGRRDVYEFIERLDGKVDVGDVDGSEGRKGLNALRMGSAPGFWDGEGTKGKWSGVDGGSEDEQAPGSSDQPDSDTEGWDWAGVEGTWTCVISLYTLQLVADALFIQLVAQSVGWIIDNYFIIAYVHSQFYSGQLNMMYSIPDGLNHDMRETCRISSMRLRITGYSWVHQSEPSSITVLPPEPTSLSPPSYSSTLQGANEVSDAESTFVREEEKYKDAMDSLVYALPVIHFSDDQPGVTSERTIRGTVRMISGGIARWSMISRDNPEEHDDWVMEAVQIGGIGSGLGAAGMWTGAGHENADPLGPMWTWRVA
ncbi:hypothetical protein K435DRAFT_812971 [Dendrothele bispora CBS 962.96]|uniref:F-box domain-containing protein n=1 Tax=Dendrothele bispora (strain CBS 962.96) TaxID=1314807 RepID=A0A4S8KMV7_DENBC|nr:hypothetical protein K435DRAFT_812971 [Dendrothele bispora CBS 962.96]